MTDKTRKLTNGQTLGRYVPGEGGTTLSRRVLIAEPQLRRREGQKKDIYQSLLTRHYRNKEDPWPEQIAETNTIGLDTSAPKHIESQKN